MFFSGLDSTSCFQCVSLMQRLARGGRIIICVIHQPSSSVFEMFDQLYLLAKGECIYRGPTTNVINLIAQVTGISCSSYHSPVFHSFHSGGLLHLHFMSRRQFVNISFSFFRPTLVSNFFYD